MLHWISLNVALDECCAKVFHKFWMLQCEEDLHVAGRSPPPSMRVPTPVYSSWLNKHEHANISMLSVGPDVVIQCRH